MIARPHCYVFRYPDSLAQGIGVFKQPLLLDTDSYFALRGIGYQVNTNGPGLAFRYSDPTGRYIEQSLMGVGGELGTEPLVAAGACTTQLAPVFHQVWYPPGATIQIDLQNLRQSAGSIGNIILVFWGTKYFADHSKLFRPKFPPCYEAKSYSYVSSDITIAGSQTILNQLVPVVNSDFVLQAMHTSYSLLAPNVAPSNLGIRLKDFEGRYFDNDFVPINLFMGANQADRPGTTWPEIYTTQDQALYFDLQRADGGGAGPSVIQLRFGGMQIYDRMPASARTR